MSEYRIKEIISDLRHAGIKATQTGMAEAADVPQSYISRIVNNQTKAVDPNILFAITSYLTEVSNQRFSIADLFHEVKSSSVPPYQLPPEPRSIEDKIDEISQQIAGIRKEIVGARDEISKLNQNHIDHLKYHQHRSED